MSSGRTDRKLRREELHDLRFAPNIIRRNYKGQDGRRIKMHTKIWSQNLKGREDV
jgi:hypothetical protein